MTALSVIAAHEAVGHHLLDGNRRERLVEVRELNHDERRVRKASRFRWAHRAEKDAVGTSSASEASERGIANCVTALITSASEAKAAAPQLTAMPADADLQANDT